MTPPLLSSYEYCFGDDGFILNADSTQLPFLDVTDITGLDGSPIRVNTSEREGVDGTYVDAPYTSLRTIVVTGTLYTLADDPDTVCNLLRKQYGPGNVQPFYYQHPGQNLKFVNAQGGGCQYSVDTSRRVGQTPIQLSLLAGDNYIYDYPPQVVTTPAITTNTPAVLNSNPGFEVSTTGWSQLGLASLSQSSAFAFQGNGSMLVTPNGTTVSPGAACAQANVIPGAFYTSIGSVFAPAGWSAGAIVGVRFFDINGAVLTTTVAQSGLLVANTWTSLTITANAPANAATGRMVLWANGTPSAGTLFYWDECYFIQDVGAGFNVGFPMGFGPPQTLPAAVVTNSGTTDAFPVIMLNGPLTNPQITDSNSDIVMLLSVTLGPNDTLVIDCGKPSILLNGQSRRSAYKGLKWFTVPDGTTDTFFLSAAAGSGTMTVSLYNTYR